MKLPERTDARDPSVEMLPLIDVVFLVLAAFIYASMFMTQKSGLPISLPEASHTETQSSNVIMLAITSDGSLFLEERILPLAELEQALRTARDLKPDAVLLVMADREAQVGPLVQVIDMARMTGITALTIQADTETQAAEEP